MSGDVLARRPGVQMAEREYAAATARINVAKSEFFPHSQLNNRLSVDAAVDRHFGPTFRQRTNGSWDDRAAFVARIVLFREQVEQATITVLDELVDANRYAERHLIDLLKRDGERVRQEVYVFGECDTDGRFARIQEMTLKLHAPTQSAHPTGSTP